MENYRNKIKSILGENKEDKNLKIGITLYEQGRLDNSSLISYIEDISHITENQLEQLRTIFPAQEAVITEGPTISIIMPTYKRGEMITTAIDSILKQTYQNYEIVIVDDCSPDNTKEIISEHYGNCEKIKYICNTQNSGAGVSRKNGYLKSKGEFLVFMDDDDYLIDNRFFEKAIQIFQEHDDEISFVSANSFIKYERENEYDFQPLNISKKVDNIEYLKKFQKEYMKPNSTFTTVFKKDYIAQIDKVTMLNDSSIYMRALLTKPAFLLDDIVGVYRVHDKNITFSLKLPFLIENLQEKKNIYDYIKQNNIMEEAQKWLYEQIMLTAEYYIVYTKPNSEDFKALLKWCWKSTGKSKYKIAGKLLFKRITTNRERRQKIEA